MIQLRAPYKAVSTTLLTISAALYFGLCYCGHLHTQESNQLFQSTMDFFLHSIASPGGLADWFAGALVQFFYNSFAGALVTALLLTLVQLTSASLIKRDTPHWWALSFLPALLCWLFLCQGFSMTGGVVALILAAACAIATRSIILVPAVFMAAGFPAAAAYAILCIIHDPRRFVYNAGILLTLAACPLLSTYIFPYPASTICRGIYYMRNPSLPAWWLYGAMAALCIVCAGAASSLKQAKKPALPGILAAAVLLAAGIPAIASQTDREAEEIMRYDDLAFRRRWNDIISLTDAREPSSILALEYRNLALAMRGKLLDNIPYWQGMGPECLLPKPLSSLQGNFLESEVFYHSGLISYSRRFAWEGAMAAPDFRPSARLTKRLAECDIINGYYESARNFLEPLTHTMRYRKWALATIKKTERPELIASDPEFGRLRSIAPREDMLFDDVHIEEAFYSLAYENSTNYIAVQYMFATLLFKKDVATVHRALDIFKFNGKLPRALAESEKAFSSR